MTNRGLWIDDSPKLISTPAYWDSVKAHGFDTAALMLEGVGNGFDPKYSLGLLEKVRTMAFEREIETVCTVWPEPSLKYMSQLEEKIGRYLEAAGAVALEADLESNWLESKVKGKGFPNLDKAGDALVLGWERIKQKCDVRMELTTFPGHVENAKSADVAPDVDRVYTQAYSVRNRTKGAVQWDTTYAPGKMQVHAMERALKIRGVGDPNGPLICCGLAAYDQTWPGHTPQEAMQIAWDAALKYNPMEIRIWSSKWVLGFRANGYASRFFMSLPK